jgi:L-histidine N-alpha-methyltransferase
LRHYVAVDVAEATIVEATRRIAGEHPELDVTATVGDFHHLDGLLDDGGPTLVAFLGGTIGNLEPAARQRFFVGLDAQLAHSGSFLLGTDVVKDRTRLVEAYNDRAGVTAAFNRNVLVVLNRELGADFDVDGFEHVARFDEANQWIEMDLRAVVPQHVTVPVLGLELDFAAGEELRTEISTKFTPQGIASELDRGGFVVDQQFGVEEGEFLLTLSHPYC